MWEIVSLRIFPVGSRMGCGASKDSKPVSLGIWITWLMLSLLELSLLTSSTEKSGYWEGPNLIW